MNKTYNDNQKQAGNDMNSDRTNRLVCSSLVARLLKIPARLLRTFSLKSYLTFLSRNKAYTAVNIFGLAVSLMFVIIIGLYTWQESAVNRRHSKAGRIYNIGLTLNDSSRVANCHHGVLRYLKKQYPEIEKTCGFVTEFIKVIDGNGTVNVRTLATDSTFFDFFDFPLLRGNRATCLMQKGCIVVTESFARRMFGTDNVIGKTLTTPYGHKFRVTGVVADFDNTIINRDVEALIDFSFTPNMANKDEYFPRMVNVTGASSFVLVRKGFDFATRQKDVDDFFQTFWEGYHPIITRLDKLYFSGMEVYENLHLGNLTIVRILSAAGLVILLFAIMNYVNLTVAQSGYRAREMATRRLFGCSKTQVGTNMFFESLVMCAISCATAMLLASSFAPYVGSLLDTKIDTAALLRPLPLLVMAAFILTESLIAGAIPAVILSRVKPVEVVRGTFRKQTKMVFSRIFITVQNVITIVMLACALIMSLQMRHLTKAPLGFNTENIISLSIDDVSGGRFTADFINRLRSLPSVRAVAPSYGTPANGGNNNTVTFDGEKEEWSFQFISSTPEIMKVYGLTLKNDLHAGGDSIIYLNDMAIRALQMKPTDTHLNNRFERIRFSEFASHARFGGIINNFRIRNILEQDCPLIIQVCRKIEHPWNISILVEGDIIDAYAEIKKVYRRTFHEDVDESLPVFVNKQVEYVFEKELRASKIVSLFAIVAIVISLLGLVAMSTYFIQQRAREIAVRKVFGSTDGQIQRRLIRSFLAYVGIAFVMAVPVTVHFMSNWIAQYSYRIVWWPWIIASGIIVLIISFAAVAVQSRIAARENPVKNIKQE